MRKIYLQLLAIAICLTVCAVSAYALGETEKTVVYKMTFRSQSGTLISYVAYNIAAQDTNGYWLQRITMTQPDSTPLSITQTLLDDVSHEPLRYIMHRPANMDRPENVIDLALSHMGKDEILPTPIVKSFPDAGEIQTAAGAYATKQGQLGNATLWLNSDVPVLGVVKAETSEWTLELFRIDDKAVDLLPQKPEPGGVVYLK